MTFGLRAIAKGSTRSLALSECPLWFWRSCGGALKHLRTRSFSRLWRETTLSLPRRERIGWSLARYWLESVPITGSSRINCVTSISTFSSPSPPARTAPVSSPPTEEILSLSIGTVGSGLRCGEWPRSAYLKRIECISLSVQRAGTPAGQPPGRWRHAATSSGCGWLLWLLCRRCGGVRFRAYPKAACP
jgi:hypothetical protein